MVKFKKGGVKEMANNSVAENIIELEDKLKVLQLEGANVEKAKETLNNIMANVYIEN